MNIDYKKLKEEMGVYLVSLVKRRIIKDILPKNSALTEKLKGNNKTLRDKGALLSSITYVIKGNKIQYGSNLKYASLVGEGATLTPRQAKKLTIPASLKVKRELIKMGGNIKRLLESYKANGYKIWSTPKAIMAQKGKTKGIVLFIRKEEIIIPARPYLYLEKKDFKGLLGIFQNNLNISVKKNNGYTKEVSL